MTHRRHTTALAAAGLAAALVAGCGAGESGAGPSAAPTTAPTAAPSAAPSGSAGRLGFGSRFDPALQKRIRDCLTAAGIPLPSEPPGGLRSGSPPPTAVPTGPPPTEGRGGGPGGGFARDPRIRAALEACGIPLPTFSGRPPTASPSG